MASALDWFQRFARPPTLRLEVESGAALDVREFHLDERFGALFAVDLVCVAADPDVDFDAMLGKAARFSIERGFPETDRLWAGVVQNVAQRQIEADGLSTYSLRIVPELWLLTQTRKYRAFQQVSDPDIALRILTSWSIEPVVRLSSSYKERRYRVQYGESDYTFLCRMLEDAGVSFWFDTTVAGESKLILDDAPQAAQARTALPYVSKPNPSTLYDYATQVEIARAFRPGRYVQEDLDYRRPPTESLSAEASGGTAAELALERYHYRPGAFSFKAQGGDTPHADDRGAQRTDLGTGGAQVQKRLAAKRATARTATFVTSAIDVRPGVVVPIEQHTKSELASPILITASTLSGTSNGRWSYQCSGTFADSPYHPPVATPKPATRGVESATVVGPSGQEIHTDEFGRIRVQFHWDRYGNRSEESSLWIPVNQPWGGASFGAINIPRIGQEVLVDFLGADPDRPVVMGRVFTKTNPPPYKLPQFKDVQGIRSESTPKLPAGTTRSGMLGGKTAGGGDGSGSAGPQSSPLGGGMPMAMDVIGKLLNGSPFFQALSPNSQTHDWQGSELTMHDLQGQEQMYLQAQKNFNKVVKNDQRGVIGNVRSTHIGTDYIRDVGNKEAFQIGSDRFGKVGGEERVTVKGDVVQVAMTEGQNFISEQTNGSHAKYTIFEAQEGVSTEAKRNYIKGEKSLILMCGDSVIIMFPNAIVIDATDILINPGSGVAQAIANGKTIQQHKEEMAAKAKAEQERQAREKALAEGRQILRDMPEHRVPRHPAARRGMLNAQLDDLGLSQADRDALVEADIARRAAGQ